MQYQPYAYYNNLSTMLEPLPNLLLVTLPYPEFQKPTFEQPQLDAKNQPNQLKTAIPNQTPAVLGLAH